MADARTVEVGNATILLTSPCDPISSGHTTGYLELYDERHRPPFPLSSQTVCDHLMSIWDNHSETVLWRGGRMTGWIEARQPKTPQEHLSAFQFRKRNRFWER
jgi:hypothetical protein